MRMVEPQDHPERVARSDDVEERGQDDDGRKERHEEPGPLYKEPERHAGEGGETEACGAQEPQDLGRAGKAGDHDEEKK